MVNLKRIFTDKNYVSIRGIYDRRTLKIARVLYWCGVACALLSVVFFIQNRLAYNQYISTLDKITVAGPQILLNYTNLTTLGYSYSVPLAPELEELAQATQTAIVLFIFSIFGTYIFAFARIAIIAMERERI